MSTPTFSEFDPQHIPSQYRLIHDVEKKFDYGTSFHDRNVHEVLLSGSVGSSKSLTMAWVIIYMCLKHRKSRWGIGRLSLPDLKATLIQKILEVLDGTFIEGKHFFYNKSGKPKISFLNGSEIISRSWGDKNYKSAFRSLELSGFGVEELTENTEEYKGFYEEMRQRVNRLPNIGQNLILCATNPDGPEHWAYDYFIKGSEQFDTRHVYYSVTTDNPFLPKSYIEQLLQDLDENTAQRMVYGKWVPVKNKKCYHAYERARNFKNEEYAIDPRWPIHISFDFNIAENKPMSAIAFQFMEENETFVFHAFKEFVIHSADTQEICEEMGACGLLDVNTVYYIHGDGTGHSRHSASKRSDYDIIVKYFANYRTPKHQEIRWEKEVPRVNPPIRKRQNLTNGYLYNSKQQVRLLIYKGAPVLADGFDKTKLKKGSTYQEDDNNPWQHVVSAMGYGVVYCHENHRGPQDRIVLY